MTYKVAIRNNATGEVRIQEQEGLEWRDSSLFWWTRREGNFGCDCNRAQVFACDAEPDNETCGYTRFTVLYAELADGSRIPIDEDAQGA